ncbi:AraC family transcriptional regulator [Lolliginicoccus suaedae]|uniref:AraC family transcriptional regulator n=1 Tax=Lolliginicoccus suaedae TaxID=2605429 RepID=UPI0011ED7355|nr:AraC family transcriptional regulator [Lolliginicoccus suaedae]
MLDRLNDAMDHIENNLEHTIDAADLSRIALTSEYHLRRMFSALAGVPLSEYIRRRRLTVAGAAVLADEETLLDIAVRYGYGSGEAFARAFKAFHGIGPGEARQKRSALRSQPRMSFRLIVEGSTEMDYRIEDKPAFRIVGKKARVPIVHEGDNRAIIDFVRGIDPAVSQQLAQLSDQQPEGIVGVCASIADNRAEGSEIDYYHGVVTSAEAPEGFDSLDVPAGKWAVFEVSGAFPHAIQYLWRDVFTQWFPSNPYRSVAGPEILRTQMSTDGNGEAHLWLPVERTG